MDTLTFFAELLKCCVGFAWPLVILAIIAIYREPLALLIKSLRPKNLKYGQLAMEFESRLARAEALETNLAAASVDTLTAQPTEPEIETLSISVPDYALRLSELVDLYPRGAILESWLLVEAALRELAAIHGIDARPVAGTGLTRMALERGLIARPVAAISDDLRQVRNMAVHNPDFSIEPEQARRYVERTISVLNELNLAMQYVTMGSTQASEESPG